MPMAGLVLSLGCQNAQYQLTEQALQEFALIWENRFICWSSKKDRSERDLKHTAR